MSELRMQRDKTWRVRVGDLNDYLSAKRGRPFNFCKATGHAGVGNVAIEYDLNHPPQWLMELREDNAIADRGILIVDLSPRVSA